MKKQSSFPAPTPRRARLVIAEGHVLARDGLRSILSDVPGLEVVGEAATGLEVVALCRRLQPDLALVDAHLPDLSGLAVTGVLRREVPTTRVILLIRRPRMDDAEQVFRAGAAGYLLKEASAAQILQTIRQVLRGERVVPPVPKAGRLTPREYEVLRYLVQGKTNREIAHALNVSVDTAKAHVGHIFAKLEVADRTQAAVRALQLGLLDLPPLGDGPRHPHDGAIADGLPGTLALSDRSRITPDATTILPQQTGHLREYPGTRTARK